MKEFIKFFINIGKLKGKERRGWQVHQIKGAESTASHVFRMTILSWLLTEKKKLDIEKVLKMALIHDICEVFTPDETPYDPLLPKEVDSPKNQAKIKEILKKWPTFSLKEKREKEERKFKREYESFFKLTSGLPSHLKGELRDLWLDFEERLSKEGRFVKQADKAENLFQGLEYWKEYGRIQKTLWIRWAKEIFDEPVFIEFEEALEKKFLEKNNKEAEGDRILEFLIEIGKLKKMPRRGWILVGVKNPATIAEHIFRVVIMAWILGEERKANFDMERILKTALIHHLCEVYAGDQTPYDYEAILPEDKKKWPELFDKWPGFSKSERTRKTAEKRKRELASLAKLVLGLKPTIKREFLDLWFDYERGLTKEARFVKQVNRLETLLQAFEYAKEDKCRPFKSWWIGSKKLIDDPLLLKFMNDLGKEFHFPEELLPRRIIAEKK